MEAVSDVKQRFDFLDQLDNYMGPAFTFGKHARKAVERFGKANVNWDDVHKATIVESIEQHGQDSYDVFQAISKFSPGAIAQEKRDQISGLLKELEPELSRRYDEIKRKQDAQYAQELAANGGAIKFKAK